MADLSTQSITINAEPEAMMDVIADFEAYPQWTGAIKSVEITNPGDGSGRTGAFSDGRRHAQGHLRARLHLARDGKSVSWTLVSGQFQRSQHGSYLLAPTKGTEVTYSLSIEPTIPLIGLLRRKAERVILDTALKELRKRVEGTMRIALHTGKGGVGKTTSRRPPGSPAPPAAPAPCCCPPIRRTPSPTCSAPRCSRPDAGARGSPDLSAAEVDVRGRFEQAGRRSAATWSACWPPGEWPRCRPRS